jgi:hypothetical protein
MHRNGLAIIRQVELLCDQQPWVYARTVIPESSLSGRLRRLARLGTRPLGAMLFADRGMRRDMVELARILPGQTLVADVVRGQQPDHGEIWGRRSVFRLAHKPLLVVRSSCRTSPPGESPTPQVCGSVCEPLRIACRPFCSTRLAMIALLAGRLREYAL